MAPGTGVCTLPGPEVPEGLASHSSLHWIAGVSSEQHNAHTKFTG